MSETWEYTDPTKYTFHGPRKVVEDGKLFDDKEEIDESIIELLKEFGIGQGRFRKKYK